jgi:hypothetical protein
MLPYEFYLMLLQFVTTTLKCLFRGHMTNINILFSTNKNMYFEDIYGRTKFESQPGMLAVPNEDFAVSFRFSRRIHRLK